jgi:predicted nucleotidyltransferase component of viral defense system
MLTKAQIQRIAQRNRIGMQVQERDYVQHLILWLLYSRSQELVFKGGTALRLVYGGNRYSEDLDFNGPADLVALRSLWGAVVAGLGDFGIVAETRNVWPSAEGNHVQVWANFTQVEYQVRQVCTGQLPIQQRQVWAILF